MILLAVAWEGSEGSPGLRGGRCNGILVEKLGGPFPRYVVECLEVRNSYGREAEMDYERRGSDWPEDVEVGDPVTFVLRERESGGPGCPWCNHCTRQNRQNQWFYKRNDSNVGSRECWVDERAHS